MNVHGPQRPPRAVEGQTEGSDRIASARIIRRCISPCWLRGGVGPGKNPADRVPVLIVRRREGKRHLRGDSRFRVNFSTLSLIVRRSTIKAMADFDALNQLRSQTLRQIREMVSEEAALWARYFNGQNTAE